MLQGSANHRRLISAFAKFALGLAIITFISTERLQAGSIYWDSATGLLPQDFGFDYVDNNNPSATVSYVGSDLLLSSTTENRASWQALQGFEANKVSGGSRVETRVKVISATREVNNRGLGLVAAATAQDGFNYNVSVNATNDTIFIVDGPTDSILDEFAFNTADDFHTYRAEIFDGVFKLFIDGDIVSTVNATPEVDARVGFYGAFGDGTVFSASESLWQSASVSALFEFDAEVGSTEENPILPGELPADLPPDVAEAVTNGAYVFSSVPTGVWYDPIVATGFDFTMYDGALFTKILELPSGFNDLTISTGGDVLGMFPAGSSVDFGAGVSSFSITGIRPAVDPTDPLAFPIRLEFDKAFASFTMQPTGVVPEPSTFALLGMGGLALVGYGVRRKRGQAA